GTRWMHRDMMNAMTDFRLRVGNVLRMQTLVDRFPCFTAVVGAKGSRRGDCDEHPLRIFRIEQNRVQTHTARARLPLWSGAVSAQSGEFLPCCAAIVRAEKGSVFHSRVDAVRIGQRWFKMPDAFKFPRMLRAIVPHMGSDRF